jgi:ribonuclease BN (tRNA processing enzyme)
VPRLIVVGSGDAFGSGGRFQTCFALADGDGPPHTLIDCGATSLTALRQQGIDPNGITTVVLTHLHGDHFGGLPFLILDGQFRRRTQDLTVLGPPGTTERLARAMEVLYPGSTGVTRRFAVEIHEYDERPHVVRADLRVTAYEVRHAAGAPAYAVRVTTDGGVFAYSGDTEWTDALLDVADGADVFLAEAYSPGPIKWHLDLESLDRHRADLACGQIWLTHLSPTALALDLSGWDVAYDGLRLDF